MLDIIYAMLGYIGCVCDNFPLFLCLHRIIKIAACIPVVLYCLPLRLCIQGLSKKLDPGQW